MPEQPFFDEIQIELTTPSPPLMINMINDKTRLDNVRQFINARDDGWQTSLFTIPSSQVTLAFYHRHKFVGVLFVGRDFFARHRQRILLQSAKQKELEELGELLEMKLVNIVNDR